MHNVQKKSARKVAKVSMFEEYAEAMQRKTGFMNTKNSIYSRIDD